MSKAIRTGWMALCAIAALLVASVSSAFAQAPGSNPYRPVQGIRRRRRHRASRAANGPSFRAAARWDRRRRCTSTPTAKASGRFIRCDETSPVPVGARRPVRHRLHVSRRQAQAARHDLQVRPEGQRRQKLRRADVHLAARDACRPRRQCLGDRRGGRRRGRDRRQSRREGRAHRAQVQPGRKGADDARRARRRRKRRKSLPLAGGRRDGAQRRYLRRRRPWLEQPHRQVFEGREIHQGLGQDRIRAGRIPDGALHRHGQARPPVRVRSRQYADPDLRSGREVSRARGISSACRAASPSR